MALSPLQSTPTAKGRRREGGEARGALQTALCSPDIGSSIGTAIHSQLKSTVYEALASVLSLGQGECLRGARPHPRPALRFLLPPQGAPPLPFCALRPLLASCALGPLPLGLQRSRASRPLGVGEGKRVDFPQGL